MSARIGDEIDDYCTRCHRLTNHTVAAMVGETIAHSTCRTCGFQHRFKGGEALRRSKPAASPFDQVLAGILGESSPLPVPEVSKRKRSAKSPTGVKRKT